MTTLTKKEHKRGVLLNKLKKIVAESVGKDVSKRDISAHLGKQIMDMQSSINIRSPSLYIYIFSYVITYLYVVLSLSIHLSVYLYNAVYVSMYI